ncbi:T9SS type B sorting domain-containing protein [Dawidia soli]|uniref:Gliding motility-associated C-terminal domain-containing protein n=1 Tax=Dawidia soli TaxID=2782352 RepID=A0AAP2GGX5_9BACT|nr:gliding motility-associated C-terminal domain-containing protein [Dawidia soli]MBT1686601.1 gliding motility-associated C-terminal domain-containing protein [Dawidia soli]
MLRNLYLTILLSLLALATFGQTLRYTNDIDPADGDPPLVVDVTLSHPCGGANNGYVVFTVISTKDGEAAFLAAVLGTPSEVGKSIPVGGSYTYYNSGKTLGPSNFGFLITDSKSEDVINTTSIGRLDLVALPVITIGDGTNDLTNSDCSDPDGQLQATVNGGSKILAGGGSYTYTWTTTGTLPGFPVTGTFDGTGVLDLADLLGRDGLPGGDYTLLIEDNYSDCSATRTWTITDPQPIVQTITNAGPVAICNGEDLEIQLGGSETGVTYEALVNGTPSGHTAAGTGGPITITVPAASFTNGQTLTVRASFALCMPRIMSGSIVITINPLPTMTGVSIAPICEGITSANLVFTGTTASPNLYSLDFNAAAESEGFLDVVDQPFTTSPLTIAVPSGADPGTYTATLTVTNSTTSCESNGQTVSVVINELPTITLGTVEPVCFNSTTATLPYTSTTGSPNRYSITYNAAAQAVGFVNVTNANLGAGPGNISLTVPAGVAVGTYNGTITVTNLATGCVSDPAMPFTVTIIALPTITFNSAVVACQGDGSARLNYTNTTGVPDRYAITFDGPALSAGLVNVPDAALAGSPIAIALPANIVAATYNGTLRVRNSMTGCLGDPTNFTLTVRPRPTITLSTINPICVSIPATSVSLNYTATQNGPTTYSIDFNGAAETAGFIDVTDAALPASPITIAVAANTPAGTYTGSLTVANGSTTCESIVYPITIVINPLPTITLGTVNPVCENSTSALLPYTNTNGSPNRYSLDYDATANGFGFVDVPNGTLGAAPGNITLTIPANTPAGTYNGAITVRNLTTGCVSAPVVSFSFEIIEKPAVTLDPTAEACQGDISAPLEYSNPEGSPDRYAITFDGPALSAGLVNVPDAALTGSPIAVALPANIVAATYNGTLRVRNSVTGCISDPISFTLTVRPRPTITLAPIEPICFSGPATSVSLIYTATQNGPTTYSIDFNGPAETAGFIDVTDATLPASPITIAVAANTPIGTYSGILTVSNGTTTCESIEYPITIEIEALPTIALDVTGEACQGDTTVLLTYGATDGSPDRYSIIFDAAAHTAGFADVASAALQPGGIGIKVPVNVAAGIYNAVVTVWNATTGCASAPINVTITIEQKPTIVLETIDPICFSTSPTTVDLGYVNPTGAPTHYRITFSATALAAGFSNVPNTPLPASPIKINVPANTIAGTYTATLTISNATSTCESDGMPFTIVIDPAAAITPGTILPVCEGDPSATLPYSNATGAPDHYSLDFNVAANNAGFLDVVDAPLPAGNITIAIPNGMDPGSYTAALTVSNATTDCESVPVNVTVTILEAPAVTLQTLTPSSCFSLTASNFKLRYTASEGSPDRYSIDFNATANAAGFVDVPDAALPAAPGEITVAIPAGVAAGNYTATFTVRNSAATTCGSSSQTITLSITPLPTITLGANPRPCKTDATATLTFSAITGAPDEYSIIFSAASKLAGFTDIVDVTLPAAPGTFEIPIPATAVAGVTYTAVLTVRNTTSTCVSANRNINIILIDQPTIDLPSTKVEVCRGMTTVQLPFTNPQGSPNRYNIVFDAPAQAAGFANVTNATLSGARFVITVPGGAAVGIYNGTVQVYRDGSTDCPSQLYNFQVEVIEAPVATVTTPILLCKGDTEATLLYAVTLGAPTHYSIVFSTAAKTAGFADMVDIALPTLPNGDPDLNGAIDIPVPANAAAATYTANFSVKLPGTDGCSSLNVPFRIQIRALPTIVFGTINPICEGVTSVTLPYSGPTGSPNRYSIDFDATAEAQGFADVATGTLSGGQITIAVPADADPGTYKATVRVRNLTTNCPSIGHEITIEIRERPTFTPDGPATVCADGLSANLDYTVTGAPDHYTIIFSATAKAAGFADVIDASLTDPIKIAVPVGTAVGSYAGTITVRNSAANCGSTTPVNIQVDVITTPALTVAPATICFGETTAEINFTATGSPDEYSLDFDPVAEAAGFADVLDDPLTNPITVNVPAGVTVGAIYNATLTVRNVAADCSTTEAVTITVQDGVRIVSITDPVKVCQDATTATLTSNLEGAPDFYSIVFDGAAKADGFVDVLDAPYSPSIAINIPAGADELAYNAVVTFRNSLTTCSVDRPILIQILPTPTITPGADPSACAGVASVNLAYTSNIPVQRYSIDFDGPANTEGFADVTDAAIPATGPIVITVPTDADPGLYNAIIRVMTVDGTLVCTGPDSTFTIELTAEPTITLTEANPEVCPSATAAAEITYSGTSGSPDQYMLDFDVVAEGAGFADVVYTSLPASPITISIPGLAGAGTYNAILKVRRSTGSLCESDDYPVTVTVLPQPSITVVETEMDACIGDGSVELEYTATTGAPDTYSITFAAAAKLAGFTDILDAPLVGSPIVITYPATVVAGNYAAQLIVYNSTTPDKCTSEIVDLVIRIRAAATADAGNPVTICSDGDVTLAGVVGGGATGGTWSGGTGTFAPNNTTLNAVYTPSAAEITAGTVTLTLSTTGPCAVQTDAVTITINPAALVSAGTDQMICAGDTDVTLAGSFPAGSSATTATWSGGAGTFNPNNTTLNAVYTLTAAEIAAGGVTLTLTTTDPDGAGPCTAVSDEVEISISNGATVNATGPADVCANQVIAVSATITGATGVVWTTSGDGTFDDATLANADYTPGAADIAAGTVTLTATTTGPCAPASDAVTITIRPAATLDAGPDQTVCSDVLSINLTGTFGGSATGITWTTDGDGVFGNTTTPSTTFKPGPQDIARDSAVIYLNAVGTCEMVDTMVVYINTVPIVDAGSPQTVCAGTSTAPLNGTFGGGASSASWTTLTGDGTFDDPTKADAVYTPGPNDIAAGFADLIYVTDDPTGPCDLVAETIRITILDGLDATLTVGATPNPVCTNGSADISVANSQLGVNYQLINADNNTPMGSVVVGTGATILLPTDPLTATTRFIVRATLSGCTTVEFPVTPLEVVVQGVIDASLAVNVIGSPICQTGSAVIRVIGSETGVTYQLRKNIDNSPVGTAVAGTGADIDLPTGTLTETTAFNILASNATCSIELTNRAMVTVEKNPDPNINISVENNPLCVGGSTNIYLYNSEIGVTYQLRNDADNSNMGSPVAGNGGTITLVAGPLTVQTTVNILATSGTACPAVELFTVPVIDVKGVVDVTLPIAPVNPVICEGGSTLIRITGSENNVVYQLRRSSDNSLVGPPLTGNGGVLELPTGVLTATTTFNVLAKNTDPSAECSVQMNNVATVTVEPTVEDRAVSASPATPICVGGSGNIVVINSQAGISYQLRNDATDAAVGLPVTGTGNNITLATGMLSATTTYNVFASGTTCPGLELTSKVTITVNGSINLNLLATASPVRLCEGGTATVQVAGSEVGVNYQLQVGGTPVGGVLPGNGGPLNLPTGTVVTTTVYNVLASNGTCSSLLNDTAVVRVNALPAVRPVTLSATAVCPGNGATVTIGNSETGVTYELRRVADNGLVASAVGNGGNVVLNTGAILATTDFVVIGVRGGSTCSRQLTTFTLTLRSASDPACTPGGPNCFVFTVNVDATLTKRPTCDDQADGVIVIHYSGDVSGRYDVSLSGVNTGYLRQESEFAGTLTYSGLSPDDYKFTIRDAAGNNCERTISLPVRPTVEVTVSDLVDAVCFGEPTGKAKFTVVGGNSPYQYSLDGGATWIDNFVSGNTIDALAPNGTYNILFRDSDTDLCIATVQVTINNQRPELQATYTATPATCNGNDGAVTDITATGGAGAGYTFSMDGGAFQADNSFENLAGGTHTLTVSDGTCTHDFPIDITFPGFVDFDVTAFDADCTNDARSGRLEVAFPVGGAYSVGITDDAFAEPETYTDITTSGPADLPYKFEKLMTGTYYIYVKTSAALCPTRQGPFVVGGAVAITYDIETKCTDNKVSLTLANVKGNDASFDVRIFRKFGGEVFYNSYNLPPTREITLEDFAVQQFLTIPDEYVIVVSQTVLCGKISAELKDYVVHESLFAQVGQRTESYPDILNGTMEVVNFVGGEVPYLVQIKLDSAAVPGQTYETDWEEVLVNSNQKYVKEYDHLPAGRYSVLVRDEGGCEIELVGRVPLDTDIYIPNIFTPNQDGVNDVFYIRNLPTDGGAKLVISDRWGKQVYSSNAYQNGWDAEGISDGIYFYRLKIGEGQPLTGWVEVLRGTKP